ncbi:WD repeat-containing alr2800, partial [Paramuricea clavata]
YVPIENLISGIDPQPRQMSQMLLSRKIKINPSSVLQLNDIEFNEAQKILNNVEIQSKKDEGDKNCCFGEIVCDGDDGLSNFDLPKVHVGQFTTGLQDDTTAKRVYATCQNSGVPWLACKSLVKWENDEFQNSRWWQFGAAVSASYVQHVLKRFYIPDEIQVFDKSVPKPCLPPMVPHFIGRQQECEDILRVLTSTSAQVVSVSGPPGFGKTSLAIAVGHQVRQLGLPVYFLSLRSVKTAEELIYDLLNTFAHASDSGGETSQDVLDLLEKIFSLCKNVSFLLTTRTSLQSVLGRKFAGHTSVGVVSLDRKSSQMLVQELVPHADERECWRVAEVCGDVPLAIKLLCGQIVDENKSASEFLDHFSSSSKPIVDLLDDRYAPNDQRLKVLFESYFKRLSREEQEAFVCLSVFVSEVFGEQAAVKVIGGDEDTAKKTLLGLKTKYLVEANSSEAVLFSFHPLINSFGSEKAAVVMKEIACEAQKRFLSYYVKLFEDLNNQFLAGNSLLAFHDFELNKENIVHTLSEGVQNEAVCDALFDVLSDAEMFLGTVFYLERRWIFEKFYNLAIAKAKEQRKFRAVHQLLIAKAVYGITWHDGTSRTRPLLEEAEEIEKQHPLLISEVVMGKRMCYLGILALITPHQEKSSYYRNIVLTECRDRPSLCAFFKGIQKDVYADEKEDSSQPLIEALTQPLIVMLAFLIYFIADCYDMKEVMYKLGLPISKLQKEIEAEAQNDRLYLPLLLLVESSGVRIKQESPAALQLALDNYIKEYGRLNPDTAERYWHIGEILCAQKNYDAALTSLKEALDIREKLHGHNSDTAKSHYSIGFAQFENGDYESALQSFKKALDITQNLHGKIHLDVSKTCFKIGKTKHFLNEYDSAVHWYQQALDISVALYGKEHPASADSYYYIAECQYEMQNNDSALESCKQALDIRLKLFGQVSEDTSSSYGQMERIRNQLKVCGSSLEVQ